MERVEEPGESEFGFRDGECWERSSMTVEGGAGKKMLSQVDARVKKASSRVNTPSEPISVFWPLKSPNSFPNYAHENVIS